MRLLSAFGHCSTFVSGLLVATIFAGCFPQLPPEDVVDSTTNDDASLPADTEALLDTLLTQDTQTFPDTSGPVCAPPCTQGGTCTAPNVCDCAATGYTGATCQTPVCTTPCANNGSCTAPNSCHCAATGYTGATCETPVCATPCANNGTCTAPNVCTCTSTGYTGSTCEIPVCTTPCANGGTCMAPNTCHCAATGYTGSTCETPVCTTPCANGGTCTAPNVCTCATGYTGATCQTPVCTTPCANNGTCTAPNVCTCTGIFVGSICETPVCTTPCANGGSCTAPNTCHCATTGYMGSTCEIPVCTTPCANGGSCTAPNVCTCTSTGYTGSTCEIPVCTTPCANNGTCTAPNTCNCTNTGYTGSTCQTPVCGPTTCPTLPGYTPTCNGRVHCEYARTSPTAPWHADDVWIYVPAGSFPMGAPATEVVSSTAERPVHTVTFAQGFFIGKYEVTTRTYEACEDAGSCTLASVADWDGGGGLSRTSNTRTTHPQNGVTWAQAGAMCAWLAGRLPSEAEWEYAAKGPTTHRKYPWGNSPEPTCANGTAVWNEATTIAGYGCGTGGTWPVGQKAAGLSAAGALDMAGNLWEWAEDCWHLDYTGAPSNGSAWTTSCSNSRRVARGGSFDGTAAHLRGARRNNVTPTIRYANFGVRCLRPLP